MIRKKRRIKKEDKLLNKCKLYNCNTKTTNSNLSSNFNITFSCKA